ncbi:MAG TPA: hypothetical protein VK590_16530, partial [Saprospiraceae bacterium]|nr:hypothetical protein [Saprospiraceae bacterium]
LKIQDATAGVNRTNLLHLTDKEEEEILKKQLTFQTGSKRNDLRSDIANRLSGIRYVLSLLCDNDPVTIRILNSSLYNNSINGYNNNGDILNDQLSTPAFTLILRKYKLDAKTATNAVLLYINSKVGGGECICFDQQKIALLPKTGYVNEGEAFEADLFLAAFSSNPGSGVKILVNNDILYLKDGVANFVDKPKEYGKHLLNIYATIINPSTRKMEVLKNTFKYEVFDRSISVNSDKTRVLYIGINNPISVSIPGIKADDLTVQISGYGKSTLVKVTNTNYIIRVKEETRPGEYCVLNIKSKEVSKRIRFIVKRIPDPVIHIDKAQNYEMDHNDFRTQNIQLTYLNDSALTNQCKLKEFTLVRMSNLKIAEREVNVGSVYNAKCQSLINSCKEGDIYYYSGVKANCPGDRIDRILNPLILTIK